ncbi:ADP-ribosylarginine hydrolase [Danio aesculapii]|uniref:ADP-ribosylarginine hydrolase n=1 Tax=Danio aesculapii TaxID=1142201 RepID=UPI0024BFB883|nr:ADP-ribosylarginine hydrolase [Danio aesculapii]
MDCTVDHYTTGMLLSAAGDALGYRNQLWEYNQSGPAIHQELQELGGLKNIKVELPDWPVSDDTVLHLATAEALATAKDGEELLHEVAFRYVEGMKDMEGRKPGPSSILGISQLRPGTEGGYRVPYNPEATGCGAAMRSMCIGLRYPHPCQLSSLVGVAVETGRMTHSHPIGFLGAVASALFTAYAVQRRPITTWGLGLLEEACPVAKTFVQSTGYAVTETERDWDYFTEKWKWRTQTGRRATENPPRGLEPTRRLHRLQGRKDPSFFFTKKNSASAREVDGTVVPAASDSVRYFLGALRSGADKE